MSLIFWLKFSAAHNAMRGNRQILPTAVLGTGAGARAGL